MPQTLPRLAQFSTWSSLALAAVASGAGLGLPRLYGDMELGPAMRGQDLVTLLSLPVLAWVHVRAERSDTIAAVTRLGVLGYLVYTYTGAAFAYLFNGLFLVYLALFHLTLLALVLHALATDSRTVQARIGKTAPRKAVALFLLFIALVLSVSELGQVIISQLRGTLPALIERADGAGNFVYVLDLAVIAPMCVWAAIGLWRSAPWSDVLAGALLIKALSMGLSLLSMTAFSWRAGQPLELGLTVAYALIAFGAGAFTWWFFMPRERAEA